MIGQVSSLNRNDKLEVVDREPQPEPADWATRAVTCAHNSSCCRFITQSVASQSARQFLVVSATSLLGAVLSAASFPNYDDSFLTGLQVGFATGLVGCVCYNVYHNYLRSCSEKPPQSEPNWMFDV